MEVVKNEIDSKVFGKTFLEIKGFSYDKDFVQFENAYINEYNPFYVSLKVPIENLEDIHSLEKNGFNFIETQIRETLRLKKIYDHFNFYPYKIEQVSNESDLQTVLDIASNTFKHDRFSLDPMLPNFFSSERYMILVRKAHQQKDEFLYKFFNSDTGEILGFKTHKIVSDTEALMYLGGILEKYKRSPLPAINGYLELNELFKKGITKITTHISGGNYGVLNLEVKEFGYKVSQTFMILRKIYL
ncbi:MAG: hypothetical protein WCX31_18790 [Salinivirgaceae bacterium]|jgi:hypothetical protein